MIKRGATICFLVDEPLLNVMKRYPGLSKDKYKRIYDNLGPLQMAELDKMSPQEQRELFSVPGDYKGTLADYFKHGAT